MKIRKLAEAIILQSVEDLWDKRHRIESIEFFSGEGFRLCSDMAGFSDREKTKMLGMVRSILRQNEIEQKAHINSGSKKGEFDVAVHETAQYT